MKIILLGGPRMLKAHRRPTTAVAEPFMLVCRNHRFERKPLRVPNSRLTLEHFICAKCGAVAGLRDVEQIAKIDKISKGLARIVKFLGA